MRTRENVGSVVNSSNRFSEMGDFLEGAYTLEEERNCIGFVLFKPDATKTLLDLPIRSYIEKELTKGTSKPVGLFGFTRVCLNSQLIVEIYPEQEKRQFMGYIEEHLSSGPVEILLVASTNAPQELGRLKGSVKNATGVRGSFTQSTPISDEKYSRWEKGGFDKEETRRIGIDVFAANLIHTPDNREDTKRIIDLLYPRDDLADLIEAVPIFSRWYNSGAI